MRWMALFNYLVVVSREITAASPGYLLHLDQQDDSCAAESRNLKSLTVLYTRISGSATQEGSLIAFQLQNNAGGFGAMCSSNALNVMAVPDEGDYDVWYGCFIESRDPNRAASFQYSTASKELTLNVTWDCGGPNNGTR